MGSAHTDTKVKNNDEGHSQKLSKNISNGFYTENSWWRSLEFIAILNSDTALFEISSKVFHRSFSKFFHHWNLLKNDFGANRSLGKHFKSQKRYSDICT